MAAFHQHWNINTLHVDVECRWQAKILQLFTKIWNSNIVLPYLESACIMHSNEYKQA